MKTYYMKIRDKYIDAVRQGIKKHEYRLASPERTQIRIGDNIILISNQNKKEYVRTTVKGKTIYKDWEEALEKNWQSDFKDLYSTLDDALKECYRFYTKQEVDEYGIISFDIEPCYVDYCSTSVLLDTNIFIKREGVNNVSFEVATLFNWFDKKNITRYVHAKSKDEIASYKDIKVRDALLLKLNSYNELPSFPVPTDEVFDKVISLFADDENGRIDNALLKEVYNDNVGLLVTDDNLMLQKAEMLYMRDKVLSSAELLEKFESKFPKIIKYKMLAVKLKRFEEVYLSDAFFDTLRDVLHLARQEDLLRRAAARQIILLDQRRDRLLRRLRRCQDLIVLVQQVSVHKMQHRKAGLRLALIIADDVGVRLVTTSSAWDGSGIPLG